MDRIDDINSLASWLESKGITGYFTGGNSYLLWESYPNTTIAPHPPELRVSMRSDASGFWWFHGTPRTGVSGINPKELKVQVEFSLSMYRS